MMNLNLNIFLNALNEEKNHLKRRYHRHRRVSADQKAAAALK